MHVDVKYQMFRHVFECMINSMATSCWPDDCLPVDSCFQLEHGRQEHIRCSVHCSAMCYGLTEPHESCDISVHKTQYVSSSCISSQYHTIEYCNEAACIQKALD